jgi:hypothetical protein
MADYLDEEGGDGRSCTEEEAVDDKEQCIREDGRVKTELRVRAVEEEVWPMTHIFVVVVFSTE